MLRNADIFAIAARLKQNCRHGLLNLDGSNAAAEFIHNANDIITRHSGCFVILPKILTVPRHYLRLANTAGDDFEVRFVWRRFGQARFGEFQNLNPAVFVDNDFLHSVSLLLKLMPPV